MTYAVMSMSHFALCGTLIVLKSCLVRLCSPAVVNTILSSTATQLCHSVLVIVKREMSNYIMIGVHNKLLTGLESEWDCFGFRKYWRLWSDRVTA